MLDNYDAETAAIQRASGATTFLTTEADYQGHPVPPETGVSVGEWLDWLEPEPPAPHEAVCTDCHLVGNAQMIAAGDCGNCVGGF